ncbi:sensor histidine kinase [Roseobacter sp. CCS2]|uniref:sensor histidine kinase n=1 Tax=Roseobacter sp. CCS2 TaxID=391593 RepID=UPI0000F3FDA8|nr:HAMP domain-containing sensor histidine kinase [Roseobacter sp. CCS2]EBA10712.1 periplasmic sensor signal transduction histidine kinase [Roseobacter sp. CCS2]
MIRQRLYLQIYLTIIAALALTVLTTSLVFSRLGSEDRPSATAISLAQRAVAQALPPDTATASEQAVVLAEIAHGLNVELALFDANGVLIATDQIEGRADWTIEETDLHNGPSGLFIMADGRMVAARVPFPRLGGIRALVLILATTAIAVGAASYPLVRRMTGRLERLQRAVERIGGGDLATRADIQGRDEIAALAHSFNDAADRIEALVDAHRVLLANASHELRTPLSRIRLGIELFRDTGATTRLETVEMDIAQLDQLIDEILTLSRLDAAPAALDADIDLLGLVAEECADAGVSVTGQPAVIRGNRDLLRRLVRNLVTNAEKHGAHPIEVEITQKSGETTLSVRDAGKGIPIADREKVFERFFRGRDRQNVDGYGLGLALVRQIAEAHGGHVEIADGKGSMIVVTFADHLHHNEDKPVFTAARRFAGE